MHPAKVDRSALNTFTDLPNIGPAMAGDFVALGYTHPQQLAGADPYTLYRALCEHTGIRQDPCVLDVFMSVTRFLAGEPPQSWWVYTAERKRVYSLQRITGSAAARNEAVTADAAARGSLNA